MACWTLPQAAEGAAADEPKIEEANRIVVEDRRVVESVNTFFNKATEHDREVEARLSAISSTSPHRTAREELILQHFQSFMQKQKDARADLLRQIIGTATEDLRDVDVGVGGSAGGSAEGRGSAEDRCHKALRMLIWVPIVSAFLALAVGALLKIPNAFAGLERGGSLYEDVPQQEVADPSILFREGQVACNTFALKEEVTGSSTVSWASELGLVSIIFALEVCEKREKLLKLFRRGREELLTLSRGGLLLGLFKGAARSLPLFFSLAAAAAHAAEDEATQKMVVLVALVALVLHFFVALGMSLAAASFVFQLLHAVSEVYTQGLTGVSVVGLATPMLKLVDLFQEHRRLRRHHRRFQRRRQQQ